MTRTPRASLAAGLLAALGMSACAESIEDDVGSSTAALASDPSTVSTYGYCFYNYNWDGVGARVYHPSNGGCAASVFSPLVVILHAAGVSPPYAHTDYDYLQRHLARNGFISVSLDLVADSIGAGDQEDAAELAWSLVEEHLWSNWPKSVYIDPDSVALIGHSRGGSTVRYLARELAGDPLFRVRSVISLAPSSDEGPFLTGQDTIATLQIYGTADGDTSPHATYRHFDGAGDNGPQNDPAWNDEVVYKAVKLAGSASHTGYSDQGSVDQQDMVKGYVLAFLKAHNADDVTWYEDYIRGDAVPADWAEPVFTSYSDGFYRRVIDNFDDGFLAGTTIGGAVSTWSATASVLDLSDAAADVHSTHALWTWGAGDGSHVTWTIPASKRNASLFKWLSLRIGQTSGAPATGLRMQIRNGAVWSPEIALTDHGQLAQPTWMCFLGLPPCADYEHMATIRIPLDAFGAHNDVQFVRLRFRGDAFPDTFILDNLEFSESIFKP
jgi:Chlorophyllase enzyme